VPPNKRRSFEESEKIFIECTLKLKTNKEIAKKLDRTLGGLHYLTKKIFKKYSVKNRRALYLKLKGLPDLSKSQLR
jgi:DNA-binding CsgD family transcriptional regulator